MANYIDRGIIFKIKKVLRYARIYGLRRTIIKVLAQFHMSGKAIPKLRIDLFSRDRDKIIGIVGCGNFAFSTIAYYTRAIKGNVIRATMDIEHGRAYSLGKFYGAEYCCTNFNRILEDEKISLVFISSNHASHANYAVDIVRSGKHVHIEKPIAVSLSQLESLRLAMNAQPEVKIFLGFNRPRSELFRKLSTALSKEEGSLMINWFVAGHQIDDNHWYFSTGEGGRVLGNLCHWLDLSLHLVGLDNAFPCLVIPSSGPEERSDFIVTLQFADGSKSAITFSAKGHSFEGVREILNVHRGNLIATLTDFSSLVMNILDKKIVYKTSSRDHGHKNNIRNTLDGLTESLGESSSYVLVTSLLALGVKEAVDSGRSVRIPVVDKEQPIPQVWELID